MSTHMPPVPSANRSPRQTCSVPKTDRDTSSHHPKAGNTAEQGETANVQQNTTNKGYSAWRRVKEAMHLVSPEALEGVLHQYGHAAVFSIIALESAGIPTPGEATLIAATLYAAATHALSLPLIILWASAWTSPA